LEPAEHWQRVWTSRSPEEMSWFEAEPTTSLELIGSLALPRESRIVDVGGGASTLVDGLVGLGFTHVTIVDIAEAALDAARRRLGPLGAGVTWLAADARHLSLPEPVDLWHDRAVFHFLTSAADQQAYLAALRGALRSGGHVLIATFGSNGPERCSGLPVQRYDAHQLGGRLGDGFELGHTVERVHTTPSGTRQAFTYGLFRRTG
jgi:ubiquinone/menaquinone biosynthesis C-methylase UbiE